jgi:hypothetical protein
VYVLSVSLSLWEQTHDSWAAATLSDSLAAGASRWGRTELWPSYEIVLAVVVGSIGFKFWRCGDAWGTEAPRGAPRRLLDTVSLAIQEDKERS